MHLPTRSAITASLRRRARTILAVTVAFLLGGVLFGGPGAQAASALLSVFVTNDTAHPVPTRAIGTTAVSGSVNVGNLPATQPVSGTVEVADSREPFETRIDLEASGATVSTGSFSVPAGKRLVVEFVSAAVNVPNGQTPLVSLNASTGAVGFRVPVELQGVGNGNAFYGGALQVLDFAAPGSFYTASLERQLPAGGLPTGDGGGFIYVSGYLIPSS